MNEWIARASTIVKGSGSGLSECTLPTPSSSQGRLYIWTKHSILTVTAYGGPKNLNILHQLNQSLQNFKKIPFYAFQR